LPPVTVLLGSFLEQGFWNDGLNIWNIFSMNAKPEFLFCQGKVNHRFRNDIALG
jgi:hypothetical protein